MSVPFNVLTERFTQLDALLSLHKAFWQGVPFDCLDLPWRKSHPELCEWLDSQSLQELETWKANPTALAKVLNEWLPEADAFVSLSAITQQETEDVSCDSHWSTGVPGRKWSQVSTFTAAVPGGEGERWLEWCAGKGFLGRILAVTKKANVTSLEWQQALCEDGQAYAAQHQLPMQFVQGDAFAKESQQLVEACDHAVALHACGDLHVTLLRHAVVAKPSSVSVSPCCYHLIQDKHYQPLSSLAKASTLLLSKHDLKLPLQETVTAGQTVRNKRFVEVSFRLGFDALQRSLSESDKYLPVPNVQKSLLNEGFEAFCYWAAEQKSIILPEGICFDDFLLIGETRFHTVEKMETVRTLFRRPLEIWLVLDRALYLTENGYHTDISTFCSRELTPRNLLIHAIRKK
ncbi:SAM-dependent methyltransferase [Grimontia kaedaensis]|uniref:SAM-dependent methyltransferase n=1 Tax=Grimontia kaedaensis TaxID=2872157 RepID=A0ABY4WPS3_9GAMM|nr:methyltransferase [Grimontia kaedaensis]USH01533.1 SAM-dependent methyltransferase [Grimontia kaedaensis]